MSQIGVLANSRGNSPYRRGRSLPENIQLLIRVHLSLSRSLSDKVRTVLPITAHIIVVQLPRWWEWLYKGNITDHYWLAGLMLLIPVQQVKYTSTWWSSNTTHHSSPLQTHFKHYLSSSNIGLTQKMKSNLWTFYLKLNNKSVNQSAGRCTSWSSCAVTLLWCSAMILTMVAIYASKY